MSFRGMLVHDVEIVRPGAIVDRYGDTLADWNNPTTTPTKAWFVHRVTDEEKGQGRDAQLSDWIVYLPPEVTPLGKDRIVGADHTFEIKGHPKPKYRPNGATAELHHWEVDLTIVDG